MVTCVTYWRESHDLGVRTTYHNAAQLHMLEYPIPQYDKQACWSLQVNLVAKSHNTGRFKSMATPTSPSHPCIPTLDDYPIPPSSPFMPCSHVSDGRSAVVITFSD